MPKCPLVIRLDGRAFHTYTKGLDRPFDRGMSDLMDLTTQHLVQESNACLGYTQSDEITLILHAEEHHSQIYLDGKIDKLNSLLASSASVYFNHQASQFIPSKSGTHAQFDCRCFSVPNKKEAINALIWREQDATRNSIQMLGQANFPHAVLQGMSCNEIQDMLHEEKGINWNDTRSRDKRGGYFQVKEVTGKLSPEELEDLPELHDARKNPDMEYSRRTISYVELPILTRITNQEDVVFRGCEPKLSDATSYYDKEYNK
jgi:tRNA(His) 5'-end guanylyltransferase